MRKLNTWSIAAILGSTLAASIAISQTTRPGTTRMAPDEAGITHTPAQITGGHDTDPRDHGRPVVLIAGGLNVPSDIFRKAFSGVTPAPQGRGPTGDEARRNKAALLKVLAPYGVTNDRLDEVSNRYRYRPGSGRLWTHTEADVTANVRNGKIVSFTINNPGAGYTTPPTIEVPGFEKAEIDATLNFTTDLEKNGSITSLKLKPASR